MWEQIVKYKKWVISILLIAGAVTYLSIYRNNLINDAIFWKNEAAKAKGLVVIKENLYEQQAIQTEKIRIENKDLNDRLSASNRKAVYYENTSFQYQRALGLIKSKPADTVHIKDSTTYVPNKNDRQFTVIDSELTLSGYFQPYSPFGLYVTDLKLLFSLGIIVSQDKEGTWFWDCSTSSKYLKPTQVSVQVKPRATPWEYYIQSNVYFNKETVGGIDIKGGIKKGSLGANVGVFYSSAGSWLSVGITKFWEF